MALNTRSIGNVAVLALEGRFDAHVTPPVVEWLEQAANARPAKVVVNLADVNFIDSTALAVLVKGLKRCRQEDGDLHLCCLQQPVRIIFELTRLDKAFEIYAQETEAVEAFDQ
ncbi:MAG: STAS domain-containing protein [Chloroflexota bacterium]|nr:STAS domain-containing protein [Chloroflexota bacterium]PLS82935.1 MAG: anti-sigma factor antagonist [Chloroflexota bacterium]